MCAFKGHQKKYPAGSRYKCIFKEQMHVGQREAANPMCTALQEPPPGDARRSVRALHACNSPGETERLALLGKHSAFRHTSPVLAFTGNISALVTEEGTGLMGGSGWQPVVLTLFLAS